jgi:thioredoxin-like negative regulator of GroEL
MMPKIICVFLLTTACVSAQGPTAREPGDAMWSKEDEKKLFLAKAAAFEQIGAHLEASFYLEAALSKGDDERRALPGLITALVRADRLRAAKKYLARLADLEPDNPYIRDLQTLLARLATAE